MLTREREIEHKRVFNVDRSPSYTLRSLLPRQVWGNAKSREVAGSKEIVAVAVAVSCFELLVVAVIHFLPLSQLRN
jgi:hypothetical protein